MLSPCMVVVVLSLLAWRIGIWVIGMELYSVDSDSSEPCLVDSRSLWLDIIHKSKDWLMERPPMKIVQP
jgi:hypothetical protein